MLNVFSGRVCEEKVLGSDSNERPTAYYIAFYCLLYCIILSTGFTVRKLYYVSILFYYASVFDFPKYKKCFIALCYGRKKNTSFLEVSQFLSKGKNNNKKQTKTAKSGVKLVNSHTFPPVLEYPQVKVLAGKKSKRLTFLLIADCKKFLFSHLPKQGRLNMLEQHQEKKKRK